jgi:hypothetical protein
MIIHANTKNYNQLFTERLILNQILSAEQLSEHIEKLSDKINYMPTDDELLEKGFNSADLINKQSKGILYLIETKIRQKHNHSTQLLGLNKYSLEHIMPKKWENNWGKIENKDNRNRKLLTLGNLAIITQPLNAKIKDANWNDKKKKLVLYSADIETLNKYLGLEKWDEAEIEKRAKDLYEKAKEIWKIPQK